MATRRATPGGPRLGGAEAAELRLTSLDCGLKLAPGALLRRTANARKRNKTQTRKREKNTQKTTVVPIGLFHMRATAACAALWARGRLTAEGAGSGLLFRCTATWRRLTPAALSSPRAPGRTPWPRCPSGSAPPPGTRTCAPEKNTAVQLLPMLLPSNITRELPPSLLILQRDSPPFLLILQGNRRLGPTVPAMVCGLSVIIADLVFCIVFCSAPMNPRWTAGCS